MRTMSGSPCLHYGCSNRNSFGYCKTTVCINEHYQQEQWGLQSTTNKSEGVVIKQQTNADRIRAMTDEELARWLSDMHDSVTCPNYGNTDCNPSCRVCWLDWLQMARGKANDNR